MSGKYDIKTSKGDLAGGHGSKLLTEGGFHESEAKQRKLTWEFDRVPDAEGDSQISGKVGLSFSRKSSAGANGQLDLEFKDSWGDAAAETDEHAEISYDYSFNSLDSSEYEISAEEPLAGSSPAQAAFVPQGDNNPTDGSTGGSVRLKSSSEGSSDLRLTYDLKSRPASLGEKAFTASTGDVDLFKRHDRSALITLSKAGQITGQTRDEATIDGRFDMNDVRQIPPIVLDVPLGNGAMFSDLTTRSEEQVRQTVFHDPAVTRTLAADGAVTVTGSIKDDQDTEVHSRKAPGPAPSRTTSSTRTCGKSTSTAKPLPRRTARRVRPSPPALCTPRPPTANWWPLNPGRTCQAPPMPPQHRRRRWQVQPSLPLRPHRRSRLTTCRLPPGVLSGVRLATATNRCTRHWRRGCWR